MTEAEYVRVLRDAADKYIEAIRDPKEGLGPAWDRWWSLTGKLSAHTMKDICNAWLEKHEGET